MGLFKKKQPEKSEYLRQKEEAEARIQRIRDDIQKHNDEAQKRREEIQREREETQARYEKMKEEQEARSKKFNEDFQRSQEEFQRKLDESRARGQKIKAEQEAIEQSIEEVKQRKYEEQCRKKEEEKEKEKEEEEKYYNVKTVATLTESEQRVLNNLGATKSARNLFSFGLAGLLIPCNGGKTDKTEVDVLEINESGLFVMECKDYKANIAGKENDPGWTREQDGRIESFHNPIKQNENHIKNIKALLSENGIHNVPIYSVIVFSNRGNISGIEVSMPNVAVCQDGQIRDVLDAMGAQTKNKLSHSDIKHIYDILAPYRFATGAERDEHIRQIKNSVKAESNMSMDNESFTENNTY